MVASRKAANHGAEQREQRVRRPPPLQAVGAPSAAELRLELAPRHVVDPERPDRRQQRQHADHRADSRSCADPTTCLLKTSTDSTLKLRT